MGLDVYTLGAEDDFYSVSETFQVGPRISFRH